MPIPESPRVVYERNPLEEVRSDIRFPPILAIEANSPVAFQEAVRAQFPFFDVKSSVKLPTGVPQGVAQVIERDLSIVGHKSYVFSSEDRNWVLSLGKDGLSLACRRYGRWEEFEGRLRAALEPLATIYRPSFFTHTCVRYKNSIRRVPLELDGAPWSRLLRPWVGGPFNVPETAGDVELLQSRCQMRLVDDIGRVDATFALGVHQPSKEPAFIIESHLLHDARKGLSDVFPRLDALHRQAGFFFRWCITDDLHRAMRPAPV